MSSLNLFENAIDSLKHALEHLSNFHGELSISDAKQAIMNLVNAADLLVVEKLRRIDESAIFVDDDDDFDDFGTGYRRTIGAGEAYKKIKDKLNQPIEEDEFDAYRVLKLLRHSANHYEFSFGDERKENIVFLLHYIARFLENDLDEKLEYHLTEEEFDTYLSLIKDLDYGEVLFQRKKAAVKEIIRCMEYRRFEDGGDEVVADWPCHECGERGVSLTEDLAPIGECVFCKHKHDVEFCENCGYAFDPYYEGMFDDVTLCDACCERFERW
ncbi:MAG TPA: hypothetical protein VIK63_02475 [Haloplasmataceae bacterium]